MARILHIEDSEIGHVVAKSFVSSLTIATVIDRAHTLEEAASKLKSNTYDAIILDLHLDDSTGPDTVKRVRELSFTTPIVVFSSLDSIEVAMNSARNGANHFVDKNSPKLLPKAVACALEYSNMRRDLDNTRAMYKSVVDTMNEWIFRVNPSGAVLFMNKAMRDELFIGENNYMYASLSGLIGDSEANTLLSVSSKLNTLEPTKSLGDVKISDRWINLKAMAVFDSANTLTEIQYVGVDVTDDRKNIENLISSASKRMDEFERKLKNTWNKAASNMKTTRSNLHIANA